MPVDSKTRLIVKIPKKGLLFVCNSWRRISILSTTRKVTQILLKGIIDCVEDIGREWAGFMLDKSCLDPVCSLMIITEQSLEWNSPHLPVTCGLQK
jgi:hypothetical protein